MSDLCRVCRSWLPSARTIFYKHPIVTSTKRLTAISRTLSSLPQIGRSVKGISIGIVYDRSYDLSITSVTTITIELLSTLANLRALCLEGVAARAIPSKTFLECSSALTTLCLHDMALTPHAVSLIPSGLKCLTMQDVSIPCDTVFPRLPILQTLRLKGYVAGESISRQLFAQCPALDCLVLRDSCGKGMMQILAPLAPRIRKLWMHNVPAPVNSCMEDMPHLQELEIDESYMYKQVDWLPRALQTLKLRWLPIYYLQPLLKRLLDARRFPNLVSVPQIEIEWHLSERHHDLTELARRVLAHLEKDRGLSRQSERVAQELHLGAG